MTRKLACPGIVNGQKGVKSRLPHFLFDRDSTAKGFHERTGADDERLRHVSWLLELIFIGDRSDDRLVSTSEGFDPNLTATVTELCATARGLENGEQRSFDETAFDSDVHRLRCEGDEEGHVSVSKEGQHLAGRCQGDTVQIIDVFEAAEG